MKLFTVGPVEMSKEIMDIGGQQVPYFRTKEFSEIMFNIEKQFLELLNAPDESKLAILTASGTGAMECAVINCLDEKDKVLVIDGGSFGHRFSLMCETHGINHTDVYLPFGKELTVDMLEEYDGAGYTALLVNASETSTSQLYDINMLGRFCKKNDMFFIVDAVSAFLADEIDMQKSNIDLVLTASQKALALSPGLSFIAVNKRMEEKINTIQCNCMYFDLKDYFNNMKRGQTPYTPAVGIVLELRERLNGLQKKGIKEINEGHRKKADYFRAKCKENGLSFPKFPMSNSVTALVFENGKAYELFEKAKNEYDLMLTPNGGELSDTVLRIGHMGNLTYEDYDEVISFFKEVL